MDNQPNLPDNSSPVSPHKSMSHWLIVAVAITAVVGYFMVSYALGIWPFGSLLPHLEPSGPAVSLDDLDKSAVVYTNNTFGFSVDFPENWRGYKVNHVKEDIYDVTGKTTTNNGVVDSFQLIELHYPTESQDNPHEVMPIMIFTIEQWMHIYNQEWSVGAAPVPPSLLGQNSQWVIALPARYNYDYKPGWEEVDQLVHSIRVFEPNPEGKHCGGFIQNAPTCPDGYTCQLNPNNPDTGGVCIKNSQ